MVLTVTGGRVVYARTVQPAQYESKRAEVELVFTVDEGSTLADANAAMQAVANAVQNKALEMVGLLPNTQRARAEDRGRR